MTWLQSISKEQFHKKYMINGEKTEEEVFIGVASDISSVETTQAKRIRYYDDFLDLMTSGHFIPGGRILANARPTTKNRYYNNCYTLGIEDSMTGIFDTLKDDALINKAGGGVGINYAPLRPRGTPVSSGGASSGSVSFMRLFNQTGAVIQIGGNRRCAKIAMLPDSHPDIEEFVTCKMKAGEFENMNISVLITDKFMKAVQENKEWDLVWGGMVYKTIKARKLYDLIVSTAWENNEPGIIFIDTVERYNNGYWAFKMDSCNPCGELVQPANSVCCLGNINLTTFVKNPFQDTAAFDTDKYASIIARAVRFLDNVLDATKYPLKKIEQMSHGWRRIGLGFTGLADTFAMLKIKYGSKESVQLCHTLGALLRDVSYSTSVKLATEKGAFPNLDKDKYLKANFVKKLPQSIQKDIARFGIRNIGLNTCAPTGTTSLTLGQNCSSGIEPIFALEYTRRIRTANHDEYKTEVVKDYAWLLYQRDVAKEAIPPSKAPAYFTTTSTLDPYESVDVQAAWQQYIDHSISRTLNLPSTYTFDKYKNILRYAYEQGLKGFTSFNPNGRMKGILETSTQSIPFVSRREAPERPRDLPCEITDMTVQGQRYIVVLGLLNGSLYEIFVTQDKHNKIDLDKHKKGIVRKVGSNKYDLIVTNGDEHVLIDDIGSLFDKMDLGLSRALSYMLQYGVPIPVIVEKFLGKSTNIGGFKKVLRRVLIAKYMQGERIQGSTCPECGGQMYYTESCQKCACGYTVCG